MMKDPTLDLRPVRAYHRRPRLSLSYRDAYLGALGASPPKRGSQGSNLIGGLIGIEGNG